MSSFTVPVAEIEEVIPHPNAHSLDIAKVLGYQCIVRKGRYAKGNKVVYFAPDTMITPYMADNLEISSYLRKNCRVSATRLRSEVSMGLIVRVPPHLRDEWELGQDVAWYYGAKKYEPPAWAQKRTAGDAAPADPRMPKYVSIENLRKLRNHTLGILFKDTKVVVTEKVHGMNFRFGKTSDGDYLAGSREVTRKKPEGWPDITKEECSVFWEPGLDKNLRDAVDYLAGEKSSVVLYGEIYGPGVQKGFDYGQTSRTYTLFDLMIDGNYQHWDVLEDLAIKYNLPLVPKLYTGKFDLTELRELTKGKSEIGGTHIREGIVVKPREEKLDNRGDRIILKLVSDDYLIGNFSEEETKDE